MCNQTVTAFAAPADSTPDFRMTPADALDGTPMASDTTPIHLDSASDFGHRYLLHAKDEIAIRAFFSPSFVERLTASDPEANWSIEKAGRWLLVYRHNALFPPQAIPEKWQQAQALAKLFLERT